jgi:(heptosyl)LPS beta-1,4-glucosyltransferase
MPTAVSVIVLTKNEEAFIERCIGSVPWADEVLVLDSGSTDQTREIARSLGASVYEQEWLGWSPQRTKAISLARNDWVFVLEADEIVSAELTQSILAVTRGDMNPRDGFVVDRRDDFCGVLLPNMRRRKKRKNFVRLFHRQYSYYDPQMPIHEEVRFPGKAIGLEGHLLHWRGQTVAQIQRQHVNNAALEAEMLSRRGERAGHLQLVLRPVLRVLWCYVWCGGFRLGMHGLVSALGRGASEFYRYATLWEMQSVVHAQHPPPHIYQPVVRSGLRNEKGREAPPRSAGAASGTGPFRTPIGASQDDGSGASTSLRSGSA